MTWILTASGRDQELANAPDIPSIEETAHSLSQINRFNGHARRPYSVAEHSLLVCDIVSKATDSKPVRLGALLHDAHECMTGDMVTPVKEVLGPGWAAWEDSWEQRFTDFYNLDLISPSYWTLIKQADLIALATERRDLFHFSSTNRPWPILADVQPWPHQISAYARNWAEVKEQFLARYRQLV